MTHATAKPTRCRLCTCRLDASEGDDLAQAICTSCATRPEARRLGALPTVPAGSALPPARAFTPAERTLIFKMCRIVSASELLGLLNERLRFDLGPDAAPYTVGQLEQEIRKHAPDLGTGSVVTASPGAGGWSGLRRLLAAARRDGVLALVNEQVIDDFAVLFSVGARQRATLKEVLLSNGDQDD